MLEEKWFIKSKSKPSYWFWTPSPLRGWYGVSGLSVAEAVGEALLYTHSAPWRTQLLHVGFFSSHYGRRVNE